MWVHCFKEMRMRLWGSNEGGFGMFMALDGISRGGGRGAVASAILRRKNREFSSSSELRADALSAFLMDDRLPGNPPKQKTNLDISVVGLVRPDL